MTEKMNSDAAFNQTRWSLVERAAKGEAPAREDLCQAYWFPLYAFVRRYGKTPSDAEDLVQSFFVKVIEKDLFQSADVKQGKLRTFLLTAFRRHMADENRYQTAEKRGGHAGPISLEAVEAETWFSEQHLENESPEAMFDRQWALTVLDATIEKLREYSIAKQKEDEFEIMRPFLNGSSDSKDYQSAADKAGMTPGAFRTAVHRLKQRFGEQLRIEIHDYIGPEADPDEELQYLISVL